MQIVYISNRPERLLETLNHVALFMPFIDQAIACVPDAIANRLTNSAIPLTIVTESTLLSNSESTTFQHLDHQRRNYLLRTRLIAQPEVDGCFIMSDDDARPLKTIRLERFMENQRYRNYFFYELAAWDNNQTEFDAGQISTYAVLQYCDLPQLSYASHMPQIIDKEIFLEAVGFFKEYAQNHPLCEWSTYFNYALKAYPDKFHAPQTFATLCWPEHPLAWRLMVQPENYLFENYTPSCYVDEKIFSRLENSAKNLQETQEISIKKIILWRQYAITCSHPEQSSGLLKYINPRTWINKLFKHKL